MEAERDRQSDHQDRLEDEQEDVAERPSQQHREAAHRGDPHPLHHAVAQLGDQAEAHERRPEQGDLDQEARHEPVVGADAAAGLADRLVEQGAEQDEVEDGIHDPEEDPDRLADGQDDRAAEDQPGVAEGSHSRGPFDGGEWFVDDRGVRSHAASSRSERPVWRRKTSSRLGLLRAIDVGARPAASRLRRRCGTAVSPRST